MKPFDENSTCRMCGYADVKTFYCNDYWLKDHGGPPYPHKGVKEGKSHLDRVCQRCHYKWVEAPVKAQP